MMGKENKEKMVLKVKENLWSRKKTTTANEDWGLREPFKISEQYIFLLCLIYVCKADGKGEIVLEVNKGFAAHLLFSSSSPPHSQSLV